MLRRAQPASLVRSIGVHVGGHDGHAATRKQRSQRLLADTEANASRPGRKHPALVQHLTYVYVLP